MTSVSSKLPLRSSHAMMRPNCSSAAARARLERADPTPALWLELSGSENQISATAGLRSASTYSVSTFAPCSICETFLGILFGWPRAEAFDNFLMQVARHAELRVDRGTAQCLGSRVLNVRVSRSADANGDEFLPVCVQDVGQSGRQQNVSGALGHSGELGLHGFQDVVRIVVAHDDGVAGQSVRAGVTARDEAGDVDAGDGGKDGMVSGKGDATIGEGGEIRREVGADLRWLESVECDYENAGHWLDVLSVESLSAEPTLTEKATRKRLQLPTDAPGTWRKIW